MYLFILLTRNGIKKDNFDFKESNKDFLKFIKSKWNNSFKTFFKKIIILFMIFSLWNCKIEISLFYEKVWQLFEYSFLFKMIYKKKDILVK